MQKEALRKRTERVETVELGANVLVGANTEKIVEEANKKLKLKTEVNWRGNPFGDGRASEKIVSILEKYDRPVIEQ